MRLTENRQAQILANAIQQIGTRVNLTLLDEPWSIYYKFIREWIKEDPNNVPQDKILNDFYNRFVTRAVSDGDQHLQNYRRITDAIEQPIQYPSAATLLPNIPDLEWLWEGWILKKMVSLMVAQPGTGKSYIALDLAHRIITGGEYPDGQPVRGAGPVLYVDGENVPTLFKQRASLWPDNLREQLYLMLPDLESHRIIINFDDLYDRDRLWDMAWSIKPSLIIIDSYGSVTTKGENNKEDVQQLLSFFTFLARDFDTAVLLVHHLRKRSSGQTSFLPMTLNSVRGSSHITAIARNIVGLQRVPSGDEADPNGPLRMWVMKSNAGLIPDPMGVNLDPHPDKPSVARITYSSTPPQPYSEPTKLDIAMDWLESIFADGQEMEPADVIEMGKEQGLSRRTIYRAKNNLPIRNTADSKHHPDNKWTWE